MPVKAKKPEERIFIFCPLSNLKVSTKSKSICTSLYGDCLLQLRDHEIVKKIQFKDETDLETLKWCLSSFLLQSICINLSESSHSQGPPSTCYTVAVT